jgi:YVTN family beta-propeller protein
MKSARQFFPLVVMLLNLCAASARAQYWQEVKAISVGKEPNRSALARGGRELYVANQGSCSISVIDTQINEVVQTIPLGKSPNAIVAGPNQVFVLAQEDSQLCAGKGEDEVEAPWWLITINDEDKSLKATRLPDQRWDEMALTRAGDRLYLTSPLKAVYLYEPENGSLSELIQDTGCPIGVALSKDESRLYVSLQCGEPGRDPIGVYDAVSGKRVDLITGLPNVSGQAAMSPDGTQFWVDGGDVCSRPEYTHKGCPGFPTRVVNIINTATGAARTYGFPPEEFTGRISFSPNGDIYVGGGEFIKEIPRTDLRVGDRIPIPDAGDIAFVNRGDSQFMFVTAPQRNVVHVLERSGGLVQRGIEPLECAASAAPTLEASAAKPTNYALVIGINEYDPNTGWPQLTNPANDANDIAKELRDSYGFKVTQLPLPGCEETPDTGHSCRVSKLQIEQAINSFREDSNGHEKSYGDSDQLLVYIASHGAYDERLQRGFLIASDSVANNPSDPLHDTWLSHYDLRSLIDSLPIKHIFLVVDACFAGTMDPNYSQAFRGEAGDYRHPSLAELEKRNERLSTREFLTSGSKEFVPDGSSRNSPFARIFLQLLQTGGQPDGYLTIARIKPAFLTGLTTKPRSGSFAPKDDGTGEFFFVYGPQAQAAISGGPSPPEARTSAKNLAASTAGH